MQQAKSEVQCGAGCTPTGMLARVCSAGNPISVQVLRWKDSDDTAHVSQPSTFTESQDTRQGRTSKGWVCRGKCFWCEIRLQSVRDLLNSFLCSACFGFSQRRSDGII